MESAFRVVAETHRRAILDLLLERERGAGEIERALPLSQPAVSKHLRVLREAGFVRVTVQGQHRVYRLDPRPFRELDAWLEPYRRRARKTLDALEAHLDAHPAPRAKRRMP